MDNKLTKKRLSDFLSYEWILVIIAAVAAIIVWELVYTVASVRLTVGQSFKYYFDESVSSLGNEDLFNMLSDGVFSYDVKTLDSEALTSSYNVLTTRLSVYEGDALFTDYTEKEDGTVRAKEIIDTYGYNYERLLSDAKEYLSGFLKNGKTNPLSYEDLDESKIEAHFNERTKKRVYKNSLKAGEISVEDEKERIKSLCEEVADFERLLACETDGLFFRYTRYEQSVNASDDGESVYGGVYEKEKSEGRENAIYGLNVGALTGGKNNITKYVKRAGEADASEITLIIFDFKSQQEDLQYEAIAFINAIVRDCANILSVTAEA